jgi:hypothetical protein
MNYDFSNKEKNLEIYKKLLLDGVEDGINKIIEESNRFSLLVSLNKKN